MSSQTVINLNCCCLWIPNKTPATYDMPTESRQYMKQLFESLAAILR